MYNNGSLDKCHVIQYGYDGQAIPEVPQSMYESLGLTEPKVSILQEHKEVFKKLVAAGKVNYYFFFLSNEFSIFYYVYTLTFIDHLLGVSRWIRMWNIKNHNSSGTWFLCQKNIQSIVSLLLFSLST